MIKWVLGVLLLFAMPAFSQDEVLAPDNVGDNTGVAPWVTGANSCDGTNCATATCETTIDEDTSSPNADDYLTVNTDVADTLLQIFFPTPAQDPSQATDAQSVSVNMTRVLVDGVTNECDEDTGGTHPRIELRLFCDGTFESTIVTAVEITALDEESSHSFTWPGAGGVNCDDAGASMEIRITLKRRGGGGNKRLPGINAMAWNVTYASAGGGGQGVFFLGALKTIWEKFAWWS